MRKKYGFAQVKKSSHYLNYPRKKMYSIEPNDKDVNHAA